MTEEVLIVDLPALLVPWELVEEGSDNRRTLLVCLLHDLADIRPKFLAQLEILLHYLVGFLAERPDLVGSAREARSAAGSAVLRLLWLPVAMESEDWAEAALCDGLVSISSSLKCAQQSRMAGLLTILKPSCAQFTKLGMRWITAEEATFCSS